MRRKRKPNFDGLNWSLEERTDEEGMKFVQRLHVFSFDSDKTRTWMTESGNQIAYRQLG